MHWWYPLKSSWRFARRCFIKLPLVEIARHHFASPARDFTHFHGSWCYSSWDPDIWVSAWRMKFDNKANKPFSSKNLHRCNIIDISEIVDGSESFLEHRMLIMAMHCDVNPAPLPRVTGACHPVGRVKSDQIFKIRHSLTFSTIIPVSHVTIHSSIASKATRKRGIFQNHTAFVQEVSPWLMSPFVCKRFCPQFVNVDSGENREVIPPENVWN